MRVLIFGASTNPDRYAYKAMELLVEKGFDPVFGARPLKRTIQRFLEDPLASEIISKKFIEGSTVKVTRKNDELIFE